MPATPRSKSRSASNSASRAGASQALTKARYAALKRDVQQLAQQADRASDDAKVTSFWHLGERIAREKLDLQHGYRTAVMQDLARDLGKPLRNLHYAVAFHSHYKRPPTHALSWGHYRLLLDRPTDELRAHYQALALAEALPVHKLAARIAEDTRIARGLTALPRPTTPSYIYGATLQRIVDGDTMDLHIDLGFRVNCHDRFRLAGIDCPELKTAAGRAARDYAFARLAAAQTIVVKTQRTDLHGRYVAHLFYTEHKATLDACFTEGTYLNAELLESGHATLAP